MFTAPIPANIGLLSIEKNTLDSSFNCITIAGLPDFASFFFSIRVFETSFQSLEYVSRMFPFNLQYSVTSLYHLLSLIHISEPTRQAENSYAVFCLKKK